MKLDGDGSITHWLCDLKAGDQTAAQPLWERYFERLVRLARVRLVHDRLRSAEADEEDAVLSAFESFCAGARDGRFPRLADRDDLWRLLVHITARKSLAQARRVRRGKRGGGLVRNETDLPGSGVDESVGLDALVGVEPSPEFAASVAEEFHRLLNTLDDDSLRTVALARMEGYTNDEIAAKLGCARRTVARRLDLIRQTWLAEAP